MTLLLYSEFLLPIYFFTGKGIKKNEKGIVFHGQSIKILLKTHMVVE
jgi:hypothetical protein